MGVSSGNRAAGAHRRRAVVALLLASVLLSAAPAWAGYNPRRSAHPVRIAAYILYPIGYAIDTLLMRPAYWLGSKEPLKTVFGRTD